MKPAFSQGVRERVARLRSWNGVIAEAVEWHSEGQSRANLTSSQYRVGFVLEQSGGRCETRANHAVSGGYVHAGRPFLTLSQPDMPIWACSDDIRYSRSLALSFDIATVSERLAEDLYGRLDFSPRLNFEHARLCTLAEMLAAECRTPGPYSDLYGESLMTAVFVELVRLESPEKLNEPRTQGLAPRQLQLVLEYMETALADHIRLADLARMTGLSQSYFGRAFKASTGLPPYRWHLNARIRRAQQLLLDATSSIVQVAAATGFADQAHFTRAFFKATGATPAAWQRDRGRRSNAAATSDDAMKQSRA
ncbi:MAG TPA: AraC family transcriptional regulator [Vicinamibacterales bacterium]